MKKSRSILALLLAWVATCLVACGGPSATLPPPTYTPDMIAQVQRFTPGVQQVRDRLPELGSAIATQNWSNIKSLLHGPFGDLRRNMTLVSRSLLPADQPKADELAQEVFRHLIQIDQAVDTRNLAQAKRNYQDALQDFDAFLQLIPS